MDYTMLRYIDSSSQNWTIKSRVVRFSDLMKMQEPTKRQRIDFVLIDEEGNMMEGQVHEIWHARSKIELKENHVYKIKFFRVLKAKPMYRTVPHDYKVQFTPHTKIEEIAPAPGTFPLYAHNAVPFNVLHTRINDDHITSDVLGVVTTCSELKQQTTRNGGSKSLRNLQISDGSEIISVSLWGKHAEDFDAQFCVEQSRNGPVAILLCAMTCRKFNDKLVLNSSLLCKWYLNPQIQEAELLKQSFPDGPNADVATMEGAQQGPDAEPVTVGTLANVDNPHIIYDKRYIITARIIEVSNTQSWWYLACTMCNKKLFQSGDSLKCSRPNCSSTTGKPRYKVSVTAMDPNHMVKSNDTDSIGLVFFGQSAEQIIGCPVQTLINRDSDIGMQVPKEITNICGKVYTCRVSVGNLSYDDTRPSYQVLAVIGRCGVDEKTMPCSGNEITNKVNVEDQVREEGKTDKLPCAQVSEPKTPSTVEILTTEVNPEATPDETVTAISEVAAGGSMKKLKRPASDLGLDVLDNPDRKRTSARKMLEFPIENNKCIK